VVCEGKSEGSLTSSARNYDGSKMKLKIVMLVRKSGSGKGWLNFNFVVTYKWQNLKIFKVFRN
jgi:hypothetical protein